MAVGLSILLAETYGYPPVHSEHMIELKSLIVRQVVKLSQSMITEPPSPVGFESASCYLKSCHLCHKKLQPEDDIYMYKGDQGYCTEECRSKQIKMDKAEEDREAYMKNSAIRRQHRMMSQQNSGKCNETLSILRLRRPGPVHLQRSNGVIFF